MTNPKILIVDDEPFNVDYLEQELEELNYETVSAVNGQDALDKVQSESPDLILLDIMMPIMDGFETLSRLKASPATRDIPVIIISAMNDLKSIARGIQQGSEDYLPKPFEPTLLQARISASLEKKSLRDQQRKLLHTFASTEVAEELMASGFSLGGKKIDASIMFADIRSFTTITEQNNAADTIELLNSYFSTMFEPISHHGGIINQIMGDGLMALFGISGNKEEHCLKAVLAAIGMLDVLKAFNQKQAEAGKMQLKIGVGIASGTVMAGYTGTLHRATYTCVGDTVNLAARMESHTKVAGHPIIIDAPTREGLPDSIQVKSLGFVIFKGKTIPMEVFAVDPDQIVK